MIHIFFIDMIMRVAHTTFIYFCWFISTFIDNQYFVSDLITCVAHTTFKNFARTLILSIPRVSHIGLVNHARNTHHFSQSNHAHRIHHLFVSGATRGNTLFFLFFFCATALFIFCTMSANCKEDSQLSKHCCEAHKIKI